MWKEFKEFILRGNVMDLAVGIVIGVAFGAIVNSLVKDIIMPPIGLLLGKINFTDLFINLSGTPYASLKAAQDAGAATINYGLFLNTIISFLIVAWAIFILIRLMNKLRKEKPPAEPTDKECPRCFMKIPVKATRCAHCTSELKA